MFKRIKAILIKGDATELERKEAIVMLGSIEETFISELDIKGESQS